MNLGSQVQIAGALGLFQFQLGFFELAVDDTDGVDARLFVLPLGLETGGVLLEFGQGNRRGQLRGRPAKARDVADDEPPVLYPGATTTFDVTSREIRLAGTVVVRVLLLPPGSSCRPLRTIVEIQGREP